MKVNVVYCTNIFACSFFYLDSEKEPTFAKKNISRAVHLISEEEMLPLLRSPAL